MRVHQPGSHLMNPRGVKIDDWSWARTARRVGVLVRLAEALPQARRSSRSRRSSPRRLTALAPPYLAKVAIDQGIVGRTT